MDDTRSGSQTRHDASPATLAVVGAGHVGLVTAACFAALGHTVCVLDVDADRIARLRRGETPFLEPGLDRLLALGRGAHLLEFHTDPAAALQTAEITFLCVPTPNRADGAVDLSAVLAATVTAASHLPAGAVVVNRTTAPVGTTHYLRSLVEDARSDSIEIVSNPEFLAEGTAIADFLCPDRIVIGASDPGAAARVADVYRRISSRDLPTDLPVSLRQGPGTDPVPVVIADAATAELTKYASNAFLAVKISFINEIASIAEELGADVEQVSRAIGFDRRIGPHFLRAGIGWGGSCFPKDIVALQGMAESRGVAARMLRAANEVNEQQHRWVVRKLLQHLKTLVGRRVGLLGLAFKPDTDDLRSAPALGIAAELARLGARVRAYDPAVKRIPAELESDVQLAASAAAVAEGAEALVVLTEWPEFAGLDFASLRAGMREPLLLDGRNLLDPRRVADAGFRYVSVGRLDVPPAGEPAGPVSMHAPSHPPTRPPVGGAPAPAPAGLAAAGGRRRSLALTRWVVVAAIAATIAVASLAVDAVPETAAADRFAHGLLYAGLTAAVLWARRTGGPVRNRGAVLAGAALLGLVVEAAQPAVGRNADIADVLANLAGVAFAGAFALRPSRRGGRPRRRATPAETRAAAMLGGGWR